MRLAVHWTAALAFTAAVFACSDDPDPDPDPDMGAETGRPFVIDETSADLAAWLCQSQGACECEQGPAAADCETAAMPAMASGIARAQVLGLRYHDECLELATAHLDGLGCRRSHEALVDEELANLKFKAGRCKLFAGDQGPGDACQAVPGDFGPAYLGDSCAPELLCTQGVCARLIAEVGDVCAGLTRCPPGSACLDPGGTGVPTCQTPATDDGQRCNPHESSACGVDLICSRDEAVCRPAPGPGEACPGGVCLSGSQCDGTICQEIPGDGDPCGFYGCADGLTCDPDAQTCRPLPAVGEPCLFGACEPGLRCGLEALCVDAPALVCELPFCRYRLDGLCDEPEGTGLCPRDTDPEDCGVVTAPLPIRPRQSS